ncbi:MAG: aminotransferase class III-fold pyridoxal phosphate-dependent enzyme, partial [Deltaproteobacteria bacterium]
VGLGRTGRLLASSWAGLEPDFLCLSKALSGGILPLSAVVVRKGIDAAFMGHPSRSFLHSHTYTGNPITCRAAAESLSLLTEPATGEHIETLTTWLDEARREVAEAVPAIVATRQAGLIVAFDLSPSVRTAVPDGRVSRSIRRAALERGVLLRPLHDTVYWMPPACLDRDDVRHLAAVTIEALRVVSSPA